MQPSSILENLESLNLQALDDEGLVELRGLGSEYDRMLKEYESDDEDKKKPKSAS